MTSTAQIVAIDNTVEPRPTRAVSTGIGTKKLFRVTFFLALLATIGAWIALLAWVGKGIVSSMG